MYCSGRLGVNAEAEAFWIVFWRCFLMDGFWTISQKVPITLMYIISSRSEKPDQLAKHEAGWIILRNNLTIRCQLKYAINWHSGDTSTNQHQSAHSFESSHTRPNSLNFNRSAESSIQKWIDRRLYNQKNLFWYIK